MDSLFLSKSGKIEEWIILNFFSGLWKLEVSHNEVSEIPSMAFYGLERALWELHLSHNKLIRVPADSIALLKKLSVLNLAGKKRAIYYKLILVIWYYDLQILFNYSVYQYK